MDNKSFLKEDEYYVLCLQEVKLAREELGN